MIELTTGWLLYFSIIVSGFGTIILELFFKRYPWARWLATVLSVVLVIALMVAVFIFTRTIFLILY